MDYPHVLSRPDAIKAAVKAHPQPVSRRTWVGHLAEAVGTVVCLAILIVVLFTLKL